MKSYWEYAKNKLSICRSCNRKIRKGTLKLIIMDISWGSPVKKSYHESCGKKYIVKEINRLQKLLRGGD